VVFVAPNTTRYDGCMTQPEPFRWQSSPDDKAPEYKPETPVAFKVAIATMVASVFALVVLTGMDQQWATRTVQNFGYARLPHASLDMAVLWACVVVCAVCLLLVALRVRWARWLWIASLVVAIVIRMTMNGGLSAFVGLVFSIGFMIAIPSAFFFQKDVNAHMARPRRH